ncbi:MAG: threonine/serine dehydratase [Acidimicrobiales bacterium]|nr:threonine/serine dehydratase [Acidimicrobiales bacterium]
MADQLFVAEHGQAVADAARRIEGRVVMTPCLSPADLPGVVVKPECLQATGSFKMRGAFNAVLRLLEEPPRPPGLVTVSSGNHGQAVAHVARALGLPAVVVMPATAAPAKQEAVARLGATVVTDRVTIETREERFKEVMAETGFTPVHPYDDWDVIHGQGTVGLEIADQVPDAGVVAVPLGGGGLVSGTAIALAYRGSGARVVGVEPAEADDARRSLAAGQLVSRVPGPTIADGAAVTQVGERPAEVLLGHRFVDEVVTVTDEELIATLPRIWRQTRLLVEPTGALALTAALLGRVPKAAGPTVAVVSGGNLEPDLMVRIMEGDRQETAVPGA